MVEGTYSIIIKDSDGKILKNRLGKMADGYITQGVIYEGDPMAWLLDLEKRVNLIEERVERLIKSS